MGSGESNRTWEMGKWKTGLVGTAQGYTEGGAEVEKSTQTTLSEDVTMKFNTVCTLVKIK